MAGTSRTGFLLALSVPLLQIIVPLLLLRYIYHRFYDVYQQQLDGQWPPAWPEGRMRFVLWMASLPIWGFLMLILTLLWGFAHGRLSHSAKTDHEYIPLTTVDIDSDSQREFISLRAIRMSYGRYTFKLPLPLPSRRVLLQVFSFLAFVGVFILMTWKSAGDFRYQSDIMLANRKPNPRGYSNGERVFIGAMFYNNEKVLPYWTEQMTRAINYLGTDNVFLSIVESNSKDNTPQLLREFDNKLASMHVARRILIQDASIPRPPNMETAPPRIEFLAAVRNLVMQPLVETGGFDRALFSNDIFIEAESVIELLKTRGGHYDMVCGVDLLVWGLYDAWVTRDSLGRIPSSLWPYLEDEAGKKAIMNDEPAAVFTCWNGIVAFRPDPLVPVHNRSNHLSTTPFSMPLPESHPAHPRPPNLSPATTPPIGFRSSGPKECFSSEAFLLPYDLRRQFNMTEIYMNPRVVNSYSWEFYVWFKYITRHWAVRWWMRVVEHGRGMHEARMVLWNPDDIWTWDGGECQPWS